MVDVKCPKCGKNFIPAPYHVYTVGDKIFCSWTCYNHRNDRKGRRYRYKIVQQLTPDGELVAEVVGRERAADLVMGLANAVSDAIRAKKLYKGYLWRYKDEMPEMQQNKD
jgi:hypothetical protein